MTPEAELRALHDADQAERQNHPEAGTPEYDALRERDCQRRLRAKEILDTHPITDPEAFFHAALVLQHGDTPDDAWLAYEYAQKATQGGIAPARWLTAASYDRWCMYSGTPQKYGTQFVPDGIRYRLWDYDPATTDEERAAYDVPPLAHQLGRAADLSRTAPQPPMDDAPDWLKVALVRWQRET